MAEPKERTPSQREADTVNLLGCAEGTCGAKGHSHKHSTLFASMEYVSSKAANPPATAPTTAPATKTATTKYPGYYGR